MVYFVPTIHKCPECDYKVLAGQSDPVPGALYDEDGNPFCPKCTAQFLRAEIDKVPVLENTGEQEHVSRSYGGFHLCANCHKPVKNGKLCQRDSCKPGQLEKM